MLPAHGYPKLAAHKALAGHYGGPWQLQKVEYAAFPGPIVQVWADAIPHLRHN